jgi:hypothetical protein
MIYPFDVTDVTATGDGDYNGTPVFTNGVFVITMTITVPAGVTGEIRRYLQDWMM